ncbi:MAG: hypothetical protein HWD92_00195 [Flavobacteriia bacterium]|nr:hypothetical protein [Flavobacteriia bacterium]
MKKAIILLLFAFGFVFGEPIAFEYLPVYPTGDPGPEYYGFPFIYRTDTTWVSSLSGILYLKGLIANLLFWAIISFLASRGIDKLRGKPKIASQIVAIVFGIYLVLVAFLKVSINDWSIQYDHDNMKMDYYNEELDYHREIIWFQNR